MTTARGKMRIKELIKILQTMDQERIVVMSADSEGNSYAPLRNIDDNSVYVAEDHEIGLEKLTPELEKQHYSEEDVREGEPCVVFWP
jgi:hypothetical protein